MQRRNVTIALDDDTARWARVEAARRDMSVSRLIAELLGEYMASEQGYEAAMAEYLAGRPRRLRKTRRHYPSRTDVHDRADLR